MVFVLPYFDFSKAVAQFECMKLVSVLHLQVTIFNFFFLMRTFEIMLLMYLLRIIRFIQLKYTIQCFILNLHRVTDLPTIHLRTFWSPSGITYAHLQVLPVPNPSPWQPLISFVSQAFCLLWTFCINGTTQSVTFHDWLPSLSIMFLEFICGVAGKCTLLGKDSQHG